MNITFKCNMSLSKKIRSLIGNSKASVFLNIDNVEGGIGEGTFVIRVDDEQLKIPNDFLGKETNISFTPISFNDSIANVNMPISTLFSNSAPNKNSTRNPVSKLAATVPPDNKEQVRYAIKTKEEIEQDAPKEFIATKNKGYKKYVETVDELLLEIDEAKNKTVDMDLSNVNSPLIRAELLAEKESLESIKSDAWVVNEKYGSLSITDLGIELPLNAPYNLSRLSAKKLCQSRDLISLIESKEILLLTSQEDVDFYFDKSNEVQDYKSGLKTGSRKDIESEMFEDDEDDTYKETRMLDGKSNDRRTSKRAQVDDESDNYVSEEQAILNSIEKKSPPPSRTSSMVGQSLSGATKRTKFSNAPPSDITQETRLIETPTEQVKTTSMSSSAVKSGFKIKPITKA